MKHAGTAFVMVFSGLFSILLAAGCGSDSSGGSGNGTGALSGSTSGQGSSGGPIGDCSKPEPSHTGEATYYKADGSGNCSFAPSPNDLMIGAMNHADYAESAACGACVKLEGPDGEITVRIVDQCPECKPGDIDLSPQAFEKIAPLMDGRVDITWVYTACDVNGPLVYHWKEGSNQYWTAVQIRNHRHAIKSVEYKKDDGTYKSIPRFDYNYFIDESGMGSGPYMIRVTDVYDQVVEDTGIPFVEAGDATGASQLPACMAK